MPKRTIRVRKSKSGHRAHLRHIYSNPKQREGNLEDFIERYGPRKGPVMYGKVIGKVRREQAAKRRSGRLTERVRGYTYERNGKRVRVPKHKAIVQAGLA